LGFEEGEDAVDDEETVVVSDSDFFVAFSVKQFPLWTHRASSLDQQGKMRISGFWLNR
jgi:hypothetical protein